MAKSIAHVPEPQPQDSDRFEVPMNCFYCDSRTLHLHVPSNKPLCGACMTLGAGAGGRPHGSTAPRRGLDDTAH